MAIEIKNSGFKRPKTEEEEERCKQEADRIVDMIRIALSKFTGREELADWNEVHEEPLEVTMSFYNVMTLKYGYSGDKIMGMLIGCDELIGNDFIKLRKRIEYVKIEEEVYRLEKSLWN